MKKFVIQGDGGLEIVGTGGNEPHNMICEAQEDWDDAEVLSMDSGVVFVDPKKLSNKLQGNPPVVFDIHRVEHWVVANKRYVIWFIAAVFWLVILFFVAKYDHDLTRFFHLGA